MTSPSERVLLEQLQGLLEKWRNSRAHTYSSENADLYRGFDNGCQRCADDLAALLRALPQTAEPTAKGGDASDERNRRTSAGSIGAEGGVTHPPDNTSPVLSSPSAAPQEQSEDNAVVTAITAIVREADRTFARVGGSSRHWVRDCFLPLLNKHGWVCKPSSAAAPSGEAQKD